MKYPKYYGYLETDAGGTFCLEGEYFVRTAPVPVRGGPSFDAKDIHDHLKGLVVTGIGEQYVGDEAHVLIELPSGRTHYLDSVDRVNRHFKLGEYA